MIGSRIETDSPKAAAEVVRRLVSVTRVLVDNPALGRSGRIPGTRELVLGDIPYIIAYRVRDKEVTLLTIMHTSQRWPKNL
jgi:toxin ParE1/3/4